MQTPSYMDGRSIVPLLVSTAVAEQQGAKNGIFFWSFPYVCPEPV
eukprot:COSAG06_NODE_563_length_14268_cov_25.500670_12_plen_45_part_00